MSQKLSAKARADKKIRDLAYAKTDSRREKKAENQRKRRKAKKEHGVNWLIDKDYDHNKGRFVAQHLNRGNYGNGTKSEG